MSALLAAEGGYQSFELGGGEWFWLIFSAVTALIALALRWLHNADQAGERFDQVMANHYRQGQDR